MSVSSSSIHKASAPTRVAVCDGHGKLQTEQNYVFKHSWPIYSHNEPGSAALPCCPVVWTVESLFGGHGTRSPRTGPWQGVDTAHPTRATQVPTQSTHQASREYVRMISRAEQHSGRTFMRPAHTSEVIHTAPNTLGIKPHTITALTQ